MTEKEFSALREKAIEEAWKHERELVRQGKGHRQWTLPQQAEMLEKGRVSGFDGSHILSAHQYPEYAGDYKNIQLIPTIAHTKGVHDEHFQEDVLEGLFNEETGLITPLKEPGKPPDQEVVELDSRLVYVPELEEKDRQKSIAEGEDPRNIEDVDYNVKYGSKVARNNRKFAGISDDYLNGQKLHDEKMASRQDIYKNREKSAQGFGNIIDPKERKQEEKRLAKEQEKNEKKQYEKEEKEGLEHPENRARRGIDLTPDYERPKSAEKQTANTPDNDRKKNVDMTPKDEGKKAVDRKTDEKIDPSPGRKANNDQRKETDEKVTPEPKSSQKNAQDKGTAENVNMTPKESQDKASTQERSGRDRKATLEPRTQEAKSPQQSKESSPSKRSESGENTSSGKNATPARDSSADSGSSSGSGSSSSKSQSKGQSMSR